MARATIVAATLGGLVGASPALAESLGNPDTIAISPQYQTGGALAEEVTPDQLMAAATGGVVASDAEPNPPTADPLASGVDASAPSTENAATTSNTNTAATPSAPPEAQYQAPTGDVAPETGARSAPAGLATQDAPSNVNISIAILSPGDHGAVTQVNTTGAGAVQETGSVGPTEAAIVGAEVGTAALTGGLANPAPAPPPRSPSEDAALTGAVSNEAPPSPPATPSEGAALTHPSSHPAPTSRGAGAPTTWIWNWTWRWGSGCDEGTSNSGAPALTLVEGAWTWTWDWRWDCDPGPSVRPAAPALGDVPPVPGAEVLASLPVTPTTASGAAGSSLDEPTGGLAAGSGRGPVAPSVDSLAHRWSPQPTTRPWGHAATRAPAFTRAQRAPATRPAARRALAREPTWPGAPLTAAALSLSPPAAGPGGGGGGGTGLGGVGGIAVAALLGAVALVAPQLSTKLRARTAVPRSEPPGDRLERPG